MHSPRVTGLSWRDCQGKCKTIKAHQITVGHLIWAMKDGALRKTKFWMGLICVWAIIFVFWLNLTGWQFYGHTKIFWTRLLSVLFAG